MGGAYNLKPIYKPKGKAKEYGDLAINIYTGCPHRCFYCFAPNVLHTQKEKFHSCVEPRKNIVEEVRKQIAREGITGKLIHLCFTCDPYPLGYDSTPTREIIKAIHESGNNVQILTKNGRDAIRDFDLLDENDWFGVTLDGLRSIEQNTALRDALYEAYKSGINTWVSFEPVIDEQNFYIDLYLVADYVNKVKIGKLNYHSSNINWKEFGEKTEALCKKLGIEYYIKDSLREEMNKL